MSGSRRIEGNRVYCHVCGHQWDRAQGGLQCPACESEFVEIIDTSSPFNVPPHPQSPPASQSPNPFQDHNPWAPDPDEDDITTFEFNAGGGGRGTFSFTSRSYTFGGGNINTSRNGPTDEIGRNFETMLGNIMGLHQRSQPAMTGHYFELPPNRHNRSMGSPQPGQPPDLFSMLFQGIGQPRNANLPPSPFDLIGAMLNPANARHGDTVFSQEAFDRVMTQLMEQNSSSAPGPASDTAIAALRKKPVDQEMMGSDGKAECSICMDSLELGNEVTVLPCNHWFHGDCVVSWLREHDTCPHCRKPITNSNEGGASPTSTRRRRTSRRSSSIASPINPVVDGTSRNMPFPDSPSGLREARHRYYGTSQPTDLNTDRPSEDRRSSDQRPRSSDNGSSGGVTGWIRNRLPFSG